MNSPTDPLQAQFDGIPVPCYSWRSKDGDFVLERANRAAYQCADGRLPGLIGRRLPDIYPDRPDIAADVARALAERTTVRREMNHRLATTGEIRQLDVSYVFVPPDQVMVHADDITDLRENEERLRAVIATFEAGLLTIDLQGRVTDANPAACAIFGLDRERLLTDPAWWQEIELRFEDGIPISTEEAAQTLFGGEEAHDVTVLLTRPAGDVVTVKASHRLLRSGPGGRTTGVVISFTDVTEELRLQERVARQALHDPLTGLPNRFLFQERLEQALARPQRARLAVLLIGLDRFRAINDSHGHAVGDQVLIEVATRLDQARDPSCPLARFGGDEFAVLAELSDEREAASLARRLTRALEAPLRRACTSRPRSASPSRTGARARNEGPHRSGPRCRRRAPARQGPRRRRLRGLRPRDGRPATRPPEDRGRPAPSARAR